MFAFVDYMISVTNYSALLRRCESSHRQHYVNELGYEPITLYLPNNGNKPNLSCGPRVCHSLMDKIQVPQNGFFGTCCDITHAFKIFKILSLFVPPFYIIVTLNYLLFSDTSFSHTLAHSSFCLHHSFYPRWKLLMFTYHVSVWDSSHPKGLFETSGTYRFLCLSLSATGIVSDSFSYLQNLTQ